MTDIPPPLPQAIPAGGTPATAQAPEPAAPAAPPQIAVGGGGDGYRVVQNLLLSVVNRHGLIAGATGTGKTVTMQVLAEHLSANGVPVFLTDIKGDVSGIATAGSESHKLHGPFAERSATIGIPLEYRAAPVVFWDIFGQQGHPVRTTVAEIGPLILGRLLDLTEVQEGVLNVAFTIADEQGWPVLDLEDLQTLLRWMGDNARDVSVRYGNVTAASIGAIQRSLLILEQQGGASLFGEPALDLMDLIRTTHDGRGHVNLLASDKLMASPRLYATFLLWLLSELFERLPEVGNPEKPKLVLFFDEAHLLFNDAPSALVEKVEQVARLIRSKGVGVFFITQNPIDVPETVLGQLGNRFQHALRAYTPKEAQALKKAGETYRPNPAFDTAEAIAQVGTGEAVTSLLDAKGVPGIAERTLIRPPMSRLGPLTPEERAQIMADSPMAGRYDTPVDRESAHEILTGRMDEAAETEAKAAEAKAADEDARAKAKEEEEVFARARRISREAEAEERAREREIEAEVRRRTREERSTRSRSRSGTTFGDAMSRAVVRELGGTTGRRIVRGILGGLFRG